MFLTKISITALLTGKKLVELGNKAKARREWFYADNDGYNVSRTELGDEADYFIDIYEYRSEQLESGIESFKRDGFDGIIELLEGLKQAPVIVCHYPEHSFHKEIQRLETENPDLNPPHW